MDESGEFISSLTCHGKDVGYFLTSIDGENYRKIENFEEFAEFLGYTHDIPVNRDDFKDFINNLTESERNEACFKASHEVVFCCVNHGDVDAAFSKIHTFASFIIEEGISDITQNLAKALIFSLSENFFNLTSSIEESGRSKTEWPISQLTDNCNRLMTTFDPETNHNWPNY